MSMIPKPPVWRLFIREDVFLEFRTQPPSPRRRRALKRWFGWTVQLKQISGDYLDA
jgi:hypothetical protein